jgi:GNAT superfamily N-acetyltransferase
MTPEIVTALNHADVVRLAVLHRASLPRSMISVLGQDAVVRYYDMVLRSFQEIVAIARNEQGIIDAGVVVSRKPATLLNRFSRVAPTHFAAEICKSFVLSGDVRRRFFRRIRESEPHGLDGIPELVQIFTDSALRGRGIGADLVRTCEDALRRAGDRAYVIRTHRDNNDAGIRFYLRLGFTKIGETRSFGDHYVVMKKDLR